MVTLIFRILDEKGQPLAGVPIGMTIIKDGPEMRSPGETDATGRFEHQVFPGAQYRIDVVADGFVPILDRTIEVSKGQRVQRVVIVLEEP